jgi:hypothetical protein
MNQTSFGPKAFTDQCKAMEKGKIKISESNLQKRTEWLFQINKIIINLGIYTHEQSIKELNKIIIESFPPKAMVKYIVHWRRRWWLRRQARYLELMMRIDNKFRLKAEAALLEKKANPKHDHSNKNSNKEKGESKGEQEKKHPCRKHNGKHKYRDCPEKDN